MIERPTRRDAELLLYIPFPEAVVSQSNISIRSLVAADGTSAGPPRTVKLFTDREDFDTTRELEARKFS
jgi:hypothetical protein